MNKNILNSSRRDTITVNCTLSTDNYFHTSKKLFTVSITPFSTFASMRKVPSLP